MNKHALWGNKIKDPVFYFKMFAIILFPTWILMLGIWNYNMHAQSVPRANGDFSWEATRNALTANFAAAPLNDNETGKTSAGATNENADNNKLRTITSPLVVNRAEHKKNIAVVDNTAVVKEKIVINENKLRNERVAAYFKYTKELLVFNYAYKSTDYLAEDSSMGENIEKYASGQESFSKIVIIGHTDNIGSEVYNIDLGMKRAERIKSELVDRGFNASDITTMSYGESKPIDTNSTPEGRAVNRRAEILFIGSSD